MNVGDKMFHYKDSLYSSGYYEGSTSHVTVNILNYQVIRVTPKGCWVSDFYGSKPRFVLNQSRKRFAWATKEDALVSFIARKRRQIRIVRAQLGNAENALFQAEQLQMEAKK